MDSLFLDLHYSNQVHIQLDLKFKTFTNKLLEEDLIIQIIVL